MGGDLGELQRRLLSRRQQHRLQCATFNGLALFAAALVLGIVSVLLWRQMSPLDLWAGAGHAASSISID